RCCRWVRRVNSSDVLFAVVAAGWQTAAVGGWWVNSLGWCGVGGSGGGGRVRGRGGWFRGCRGGCGEGGVAGDGECSWAGGGSAGGGSADRQFVAGGGEA